MMWTWRSLVTVTIVVLLAAAPMPAGAAPASFTDPDDVSLPLDLKSLTHDQADSAVVYTVETYEPFEDRQVDFKWGIDTNNDQKLDRQVSVEFEGAAVVAKVEDTQENELGPAKAERTGPGGLRLSFSRDLLGAASYQYRVTAVTDKNGNDEDDKGETDVAPDKGFHPHRI